MDDATIDRLAELAVRFGSNVQPGQIVAVGAEVGKERVARAVAAAAYTAGAKFVDVSYFDLRVKRARIEHAAEDTLDFVPSWYGERLLALGDQRAARVGLSGPADPHALEGLDPARVGRDLLPGLRETGKVVNDATTNWTIIPALTQAWADLVHPDLAGDAAYARLSEQLVHIMRLDEADPVAAWTERFDLLVDVALRLNERHFSALHFEGPGTDLTVGLVPTCKFLSARFETVDGIVHMPNLPSEEIFGAPDPQRTDGVVRATKPLVLGGTIIRGLEVEFAGGKVVRLDAETGADVLRGYVAKDEGSGRLGEVALVDGQGRIGPLDTVFFDTLLDENAASHIALGNAYSFTAGEEDKDRLNQSAIHVDFMIGSPEVSVTGVADDGTRTPVLVGGAWQI
jgi:aminopeptidase